MTIVVVGAPRSGTTALYKALCLHPDAAWISNWLARAPRVGSLAYLNRVASVAPRLRLRSWFGPGGSEAYSYMRARSAVERAFPAPVEGGPVFRQVGAAGPSDREPGTGPANPVRVGDLLRRLAGRTGGEVLVIKRVANNAVIPFLAEALPDATFVHVVRDGRAVCSSLNSVDWWPTYRLWWHENETTRTWAARGGDPMAACAGTWVAELLRTERHLANLDPARVLELRYETLTNRGPHSIREVGFAGGLSPSARWDEELARIRFPDRNERWRSQLSEQQQQVITERAGHDLVRLGYLDPPEPELESTSMVAE